MITFEVQPQRSEGRGYVPCGVHQATSWALVKTERYTARGRKFVVLKVIGRYKTRTEAEGMKSANNQSHKKVRGYKLGRRIIKGDER